MTHFLRALLVCAGAAGMVCGSDQADAPGGAHDRAFDKIPFEEWIAGGDSPARIKWSAHVTSAQLSFHQRLTASVMVEVDGAELAHRRGKGAFVVLAQFTDGAGTNYRSHAAVDLTRVEEGLSASNVGYTMRAFVLPGAYRVAILLLDSASKEHWSKTEKVQFGSLHHDPLPDSWRDLPPIEFVSDVDPPESWLQPRLSDHLNINAKAKSPARIDVLVNLTPSEQRSGSARVRNATLGALIPTLQAISEIQLGDASMNVALLDLSRRRVVLHRDHVHNLDWESLKSAFAEDSTNTIDVKSLEDRGRNAAFFVKEVSKRMSANVPAGTKHLVIVLSGTTAFEAGEDLRPIEATSPSECPVFYIRYEAPPVMRIETAEEQREREVYRGRRGMGDMGRRRVEHSDPADQLEKTLKPVSPRVFDVGTPEQMRKAIGEIRAEIENL